MEALTRFTEKYVPGIIAYPFWAVVIAGLIVGGLISLVIAALVLPNATYQRYSKWLDCWYSTSGGI